MKKIEKEQKKCDDNYINHLERIIKQQEQKLEETIKYIEELQELKEWLN